MRKNSICMLLSMTLPTLWLLLTMMEKIGFEKWGHPEKNNLNFLLKTGKKYMCNSKNPSFLQECHSKWFFHITIAFKRKIIWFTNIISH